MKPVLVTGANRSGTTWVGRMLSLAPELFYVWEPFNPEYPLPMVGHPLNAHYRRLLPEEYSRMRRFLKLKTFGGLISASEGGHSLSAKLRKLGGIYHNTASLLTGRIAPLYKDPIALMSAEWMEQETGARVVITTRHPGAYLNSVKRLGWKTGLKEFVRQPLVLDSLPADLKSLIIQAADSGSDKNGFVLEEAALWWRIFYWTVDRYRTEHPDWIIVRHEDLSLDYLGGFKSLFEALDLSWSDEIIRELDFACSSINTVVQGAVCHPDRQNSAGVVRVWKTSLSHDEQAKIRRITEPVSQWFYDDASWE